MTGQLDWLRGGIALAFAFLIAVWMVKPIGVSTQFVIADGMAWDIVSPGLVMEDPATKSGYDSDNAYLAKSGGKYAKNVANPINYSFVFVLAMVFGAWLSRMTRGPQPSKADRVAPRVWRNRFGNRSVARYALAFAGGFLVLYGARLAGGCTSGHMMSGMMQTSVSGYLFALTTFATGIAAALTLYRRGDGHR